ncbi:SRPBCC family protein [Ferruginibacter lapsinanis]|uniref:SRPBCC family protein n=1 Tax=Ferruginibacter lapsinanis TaxID=563172 RepID=UPI001E61994E|nr:SRPBCC family protein [Ferruginibacter lapsinanis]UEG50810.1 SRPBCC family protein [Ferruginibacter lapsinanis]
MSTIHLTTFIAAPIERVFDLSRSINLHKISTAGTHEEAVGGTTNGLINEGETVTWRAKHLLKIRLFTSQITKMTSNEFFCDEMIKGDFKNYKHEHHFKAIDNGTIMIDILEFESPYGKIGKLFNQLYLTDYLKTLLINRNNIIKEYAETQKWKAILN